MYIIFTVHPSYSNNPNQIALRNWPKKNPCAGFVRTRNRAVGKKGQLHKVFKDSFDAKAIFSQRFLKQKINYIHYNPVSGKWMLVNDFVEYEHSSASFYEIQSVKHFRPVHYLDL